MKLICKVCKTLTLRIRSSKTNSHGAIFVDHTDRQWYGRVCPNCRYDTLKPKKPKAGDIVNGKAFCIHCNLNLPKLKTDQKLSNGTFLCWNDKGKKWKGNTCPDCVRKNKKASRLKTNSFYDFEGHMTDAIFC